MVRSHWMGPVFGVLAMTGLASGQSTPWAPAAAGAPKDRYVTVQEAGKPPQRCKVLKTWTESDGTPAYQAQDVETGELMTIEEAGAAATKSGGLATRSASMRIFHWGRGTPPAGTPEPPAGAAVVGTPLDMHTPAAVPTHVAAASPPAAKAPHGPWPSAFVNAADPTTVHPTAPPPSVAAAPAPKKLELAPIAPTPVAAIPVKTESAACTPAKATDVKPAPVAAIASPYNSKPADPTAVKAAPEHKPSPPVVVVGGSPYDAKPADPTVAKPAHDHKPAPPVGLAAGSPSTTKHETAPAVKPPPGPAKTTWIVKQPDSILEPLPEAKPEPKADLTLEAKPAPVAAAPSNSADQRAVPVSPYALGPAARMDSDGRVWAVTKPWKPTTAPPAVIATTQATAAPKAQSPYAVSRADDPLKTPDKYVKIPQDEGFGQEKRAPLLAKLAMEQPPATLKPDAKEPPAHTAPVAPPPPPLPAPPPPPVPPTPAPAVAAVTPTLKPSPAKAPAPAPVELKPAATASPAAPAVPVGMQSVLAAASPELAPPAPPAAPSEKGEVGIKADEPNAFTERPKSGTVAAAANAFSAPGSAAPAASPPPDALAMNAFAPPPAAPSYGQPAAVMRPMTPPAAAAAQMPTAYVVPAGYRQDGPADLPKLTAILKESLFPSQREWAAESLASMDWHRQPEIVDLLVDRAKGDPAPTVRAECVRSLGRMKADTLAAVEAVKALQSDPDGRVRQEAVEAHAQMTGATPGH